MSESRYSSRRKHIVDEANAMGTAILRADLYVDEHRTAFRKEFQHYLSARILYYDAKRNLNEVKKAKQLADEFGKKLWDRAAHLSQKPEYVVASMQMIPALNQMLDASSTRLIGELTRVPDSIVGMLFILSLATSFYLGYLSAGKGALDWFICIGFCALTCVVIFITLDLDRPKRGLIQLSTSHQAMVELQKLF